MNNDYSLGGDMLGVSGGVAPPAFYDNAARRLVGAHYNIALAVIIVLAIIIVVLLLRKESFMPGTLMRQQKLDGLGFENMDNGQKVVNVPGGQVTYNPNAAANAPGSLTWSVLNDANLDCANNKGENNTDAWSWMNGVAQSAETMSPAKKTDNELSYIMNH